MTSNDETPLIPDEVKELISTEVTRRCALYEYDISVLTKRIHELETELHDGLLHCHQRIDDSLGDYVVPPKAKTENDPTEVFQHVDTNDISDEFRSAMQGVLEAKQTAQQETGNNKVDADTSMAILRSPNCYGTPRVYDIAMIHEKHVRMQLLEFIMSVDSTFMTPWGYLKQCHERAATDHALMFGPREIPSDMSCGMYRTSDVPCCKPRLRGYDNPPKAASPPKSDNINHGGFWGEMELLAMCEAIRSDSTSSQSVSNCVNVIATRTLDSYEPRKRIDELLSFLDHTGLYTICLVGMELTVDDCLALAERLKMPHVYRRLKYLVLEDCSMYTGQIRSLAPHIPSTLIGLSLRRNFLHGHGTCAELFKRPPHKLMYVDLSETAIDGAEMDLVLSRISKVKQSMVATEFPLRVLDVSHNDIRSVTKALPISLEAVNISHNALSWSAWTTLFQGMDGMSQLKELRMCTTCTELPSGTDGQGAIVADVKKLFSRLPPGMTILQMPYMQLGDTETLHLEFWNSVARMPNLCFLDVRECNILAMHDDQLDSELLQYLDVSGNKLARSREAIVSTLQRLPNLEVLLLSDIDLKEHELHTLLHRDENVLPTSVRVLDLSWNDFATFRSLQHISFPGHLHWFDVSGANMTASGFNSIIAPLKRCTEMQFLDVSYNEMMSARGPIEKLADAVNEWSHLRYLKFAGVTSAMSGMLHNITGDRGRSCLADAASEHFTPCCSPLMRKLVSALHHDATALLVSLHRRTMHWTPPLPWIAEQDIGLMSHLPASKEMMSTLACMCFARFTDVMFNAECVQVLCDVVDDEDLGPIAVYGLRGLALSRTPELRSNVQDIFRGRLGGSLYKTLLSKFPARAHAWLSTVDDSISSCKPEKNKLGKDGAAILASIIAFMPSMNELWCWDCKMTGDGIKVLSQHLYRCFLKGIGVGNNLFGNGELKCFADAMKIHHEIEGMTLSGNRFTSEGVAYLFDALRNKEFFLWLKVQGMNLDQIALDKLRRICPRVTLNW